MNASGGLSAGPNANTGGGLKPPDVNPSARSFYAHGFYIEETDKSEVMRQLRLIGEAGFTVVHLEALSNDLFSEVLDEAARLEVRVILGPVKTAVCTEGVATLHNWLDRYKERSALLAYNLSDDLHDGTLTGCPRNVDDVSAMYDDYKTRDPARSFFVALGNGSYDQAVFTKRRFDIAGVEIYPINGGSPIRLVYESSVDVVTKSTPFAQVPWTILQTFNWGGANQRMPTPAEYDNMLYQALVAGARGTINYTFKGLESDQVLFEGVKATATQINQLAPFLAQGTITKSDLGNGVYGATWQIGNDLLAIVVNAGMYASYLNPNQNMITRQQVSLPLPQGPWGPALSPFSNRATGLSVVGDKLVGAIDTLAVHVCFLAKN